MKHLKLFESFDRYEFGEFKGDYDLLNKSELYRKIGPDVQMFPLVELRAMNAVFSDNRGAHNGVSEGGTCYKFTKWYGAQSVHYEVYSLGDYCYCIIGYGLVEEIGIEPYTEVCYFEVFDGFEDLCTKLETFK